MDDAKLFRELLEVAKEFNLSAFKHGVIEAHFSYQAPIDPAAKDAELKPDMDEEILEKIEEMKAQNLAGL